MHSLIESCIFAKKKENMESVPLPLSPLQVEILRITSKMNESDQLLLKKIIIAFKQEQLQHKMDKFWDEHNWTQETVDKFLETHLRTPY